MCLCILLGLVLGVVVVVFGVFGSVVVGLLIMLVKIKDGTI